MSRRRRHSAGDAPVTRAEFEALEQRVRRAIQKGTMGMGIQSLGGGGGGGDDGYEWWFDGRTASADDADTVGGYAPDQVPYITDDTPPASSPTPTAQGGPRFFAVKWAAVANADLVTYEVHVSATSGFTPDSTTLAGETPGLLAFLRKLPDGSDFAYDTDYFFKIVAKDDDGSAAASTESAAEQLDPNGTDDLLAGSVTAEKMEAVLNMASSFLAGTFGSSNVQVGFGVKDDGTGEPTIDSSFLGVRAYDGTNTDPIFKLPADGSPAQFRGKVLFGSQGTSKLTTNDMIQLQEQPGGSFATPLLVQSNSSSGASGWIGGGSPSCEFEAPVTPGNLVVVVVTHWDAGGAGTNTTPDGFSNSHNLLWGGVSNGRTQMFSKVVTGTECDPGSGFAVVVDKSVDVWTMQMFEFSGATAVENVTSLDDEDNSGGVMLINTTSTTDITQDCLVIGVGTVWGELRTGHVVDPNFPSFKTSSYPSDYSLIGFAENDDHSFGFNGGNDIETVVFMKAASSGGHAFIIESNADAGAANGFVVALEAAANQVEPADADTARLYAADAGGTSYLHSTDENGREQAIVLGSPGEVWRLELVSRTIDIASQGAHSGAIITPSIPGLLVGDYCFWIGTTSGTGGVKYHCDPICSTDGQINFRYFNSDSVTVDPPSATHYFLVIHRS